MPLTELHRKQIINLYCIFFYALFLFKWAAGLLLYQLQPIIFNTRFDLFTWLLMDTGLHRWLLNNKHGWLLFDIVFYSLPLVYRLTFSLNKKAALAVAVGILVVNWIYIQCYTLYPTGSIESYTAWLLFPCLLIAASLRNFYFVLHGLRYFFLYFFASAGLWKIIQAGVFNPEQMNGILLYQHGAFLVSSPAHWFTKFVYWLIANPVLSYGVYIAAMLLELFFIIGFFTRRLDKFLAGAFLLFLLLDLLLMRIYYWETIPYIIVLFYSSYSLPNRRTGKAV